MRSTHTDTHLSTFYMWFKVTLHADIYLFFIRECLHFRHCWQTSCTLHKQYFKYTAVHLLLSNWQENKWQSIKRSGTLFKAKIKHSALWYNLFNGYDLKKKQKHNSYTPVKGNSENRYTQCYFCHFQYCNGWAEPTHFPCVNSDVTNRAPILWYSLDTHW